MIMRELSLPVYPFLYRVHRDHHPSTNLTAGSSPFHSAREFARGTIGMLERLLLREDRGFPLGNIYGLIILILE